MDESYSKEEEEKHRGKIRNYKKKGKKQRNHEQNWDKQKNKRRRKELAAQGVGKVKRSLQINRVRGKTDNCTPGERTRARRLKAKLSKEKHE